MITHDYPKTPTSLQTDNMPVNYFANIIGDMFVQTVYTVRILYAWKIIKRQFNTLAEAKSYIRKFIDTNDASQATISLIEHITDSHVIDWKN